MRLSKLGMLVATGLAVSATAASAADLGRPVYKAPPPPVVVNDWTGFYIGGHAGWGWARNPFTAEFPGDQIFCDLSGCAPLVPGVTISDAKLKGFVAGFQAGYNQQWGNWLGGLEIDLSGIGIKGSTSVSATHTANVLILCEVGQPCPFLPNGRHAVSVEDKIDLLGSARARLGVLPLPNLLLYGTGGLAWAHFVRDIDQTQSFQIGFTTTTSSQTNSNSSWRFGWVAGVGGEARIFDSNWLVRVEYLHYDFGNSDSFASQFTQTEVAVPGIAAAAVNGGGSSGPSSFTSGRLTVDVVRAGLSYKFGGGPVSY
jgi:opacity protein-like surface antigen